MGAADSYIDQVGSGCPYIGTDLLGSGTIGTYVQIIDLGPDAVHEDVVGRIPPQGGPQSEWAATAEGKVRRLGLPPTGVCDGGDGLVGGGDLRLPPPEHS